MEELLVSLELERKHQNGNTSTNKLSSTKQSGSSSSSSSTATIKACKLFAKALNDYYATLSKNIHHGANIDTPQSASASASASATTASTSTATWLYNLCITIPSPLDTKSLASAILSACQNDNEMQIQASLFDALGEGERAMEVLFEIVPRAIEIRDSVTDQSLQQIHDELNRNNGNNNVASSFASAFASMIPTAMDPEQERLDKLRKEAMEAAEFAAITKMEADAITGGGSSFQNNTSTHTHTITRTSDKAIIKQAKQASKAASKAIAAAKAAGAIVDENEILSRGYDSSALAAEEYFGSMDHIALHQMNQDQFNEFQSTLHAEGTKQHHEEKGLPRGTEREICDGYETVTIPAPFLNPEQLHSRIVISDVMNKTEGKAFAGTKSLNPMQSTVFEAAFHTNENLLICAPTGAGKTNVAMLTVVAHLRDKGIIKNENDPYSAYQHIGRDNGGGRNKNGATVSQVGRKIIYIAPMKALAQEVVEKFSSKLKPLNIVVKELTGDMQLTRAEADRADILVTTPEKWDVVTRKSSDDSSLGSTCGLLIIDEVHLLADERGAVIESVVARLHRLVESSQRSVRLVGLSATLPNYKDVASFLRVHPSRGLFHFGPEHRPVPLQQTFVGINDIKPRFRYDTKVNEVCYDVVQDSLQRGYQVMVFVHSRKGTGETARALAEIAAKRDELERYFITMGSEENGNAHSKYSDRAEKSRNKEVREHFNNGMGIHHAGMLRHDRKLTEQMFADGAIKVLCCTATLAWGINLPAHTVVVKGTDVYNAEKGGNVDLSILDVMQIFGRAGRPQYDTSGEATLITSQAALARYLNKLVKEVPIESNFIKQLADHLNAEIVGGTVTNISEAAEWLQYTYLFCRMLKNPLAYGINATQSESDPTLSIRSVELVKEAAKHLDSIKMIRFKENSGNLAITDLGRVASHFYIRAESVAIFNELLEVKKNLDDADLFNIICNATEFTNVKVRPEEMEELDKLKNNECALEVKTPVEDFAGKSCVLMQAFISKARVNSFTLISDTNYIASNAGRVARALFEICLKKGRAGAALKLLRIAKSVDKRIWWFQTPLRQFEGIPSNVFKALESQDENPSDHDAYNKILYILDMQPGEIGQLCRWQKGGKEVKKLVGNFPFLDVECSVQPLSRSILRFNVTLNPVFNWSSRYHGGAEGFWLWVEDSDNNRIYHQEYVLLQKRTFPEPVNLELTIPAFDPLPNQYYIRVVSDSWVGSEMLFPVSFQHLLLPQQTMPHTDLMDLTPLPTSALGNPKFEQLYSKFETFNPIQTQLFHVLYHTNHPVLLGAPTGSGKTIVAEIALLRMKKLQPNSKCVYIAPLKSLARERLKEWRRKLGQAPLNWKVLELSGDTHHDERTLKSADVLVCTPEKWDLISRGWRGSNEAVAKDFVKDVRLLVIDEIHLLGEERGAVLEALVSRTRFISRLIDAEQKEGKEHGSATTSTEAIRIVGLSTAISNPHDLADWIGINVKDREKGCIGLYNFRASVRPIPMSVHLAGFPGRHYCPRMATMNKPCYAAIQDYSPNKPVIIFVASRRQTRLTALDLINYAAGDANPTAFLGCSDQYIHSVAETLNDSSLSHTITFGIGLHHAGLSVKDRDVVEQLFLNGDIQVLVATATLAWGVNLPAHLVIVKGTEYFDGKESRYVDYPVTDVLQMMGRAGRPQFDTEGVACVFVEESKKNYYLKFLYNPFPVESCLGPRLADTLNAEIAIGTISSLEECLGYLDWTFFARRVKMNPSYYGVESNSEEETSEFLYQTVMDCIDVLKDHGCIDVNEEDGSNKISTTPLGSSSSKFYLNHKTPKEMVDGARKSRMLVKDSWKQSKKAADGDSFALPPSLEEACVASILYHLSHINEFDELPVRHNEEHLNLALSDNLPWAATIPGKLKERKMNADDLLDIMGDPHIKCYLLIQAYITRTELPISDYINDTKTIIEQIPRLLAAMERLSTEERSSEGSFDLFCMFSVVRQILNSRCMPGEDSMSQLTALSSGKIQKLKSQGSNNLRQLIMKTRDGTAKGLPAKLLTSIKKIPLFSAENMSLTFEMDKATKASTGVMAFNFVLEAGMGGKKGRGATDNSSSFSVAIGTKENNLLLAEKNIMMSFSRQKSTRRSVKIKFDWSLANSYGGPDSGHVLLRIMSTDRRGLDVQYQIKLR